MSERKTHPAGVVLAAVLALCALGCYAHRESYVARSGSGGPPSGQTYSSRHTQSLGIGASAGVFMPSDSAYANGLMSGMMWDVHASLWLGPNVAIQAAYGSCSMVDNGPSGGRMTASPFTVAAIASVPMPMFYAGPGYGVGFGGADYYRWLFGGGVGSMSFKHTTHDVAQSSMSVAYIVAGGEWLFGFGDRFFAVTDLYFGDRVNSETDPTHYWDFTSVVTLRVGLEFGF